MFPASDVRPAPQGRQTVAHGVSRGNPVAPGPAPSGAAEARVSVVRTRRRHASCAPDGAGRVAASATHGPRRGLWSFARKRAGASLFSRHSCQATAPILLPDLSTGGGPALRAPGTPPPAMREGGAPACAARSLRRTGPLSRERGAGAHKEARPLQADGGSPGASPSRLREGDEAPLPRA